MMSGEKRIRVLIVDDHPMVRQMVRLACQQHPRMDVVGEASDGAQDGRRKLWGQARRQPRVPGLIGAFSAAELGLALGAENVIHTAFLAGRAADRWAQDVHRLSGFCPLLPESWREEP